MKEKIVRLGEHLPLSTRRVVRFCGESAAYGTAVGHVEGLADGVVLLRDFASGSHYELTPEKAREVAQALTRAALAVEEWQRHARGHYDVRVERVGGEVFVTYAGRRRPMRRSQLRGSRRRDPGRRCDACRQVAALLWVAADDLREGGFRVPHAEVCDPCVEQLAAKATAPPGVVTLITKAGDL